VADVEEPTSACGDDDGRDDFQEAEHEGDDTGDDHFCGGIKNKMLISGDAERKIVS